MFSIGSSSSVENKHQLSATILPKKNHTTTVVWLHGMGDNGLSWYTFMADMLKGRESPIKWIFPTACSKPFTSSGGSQSKKVLGETSGSQSKEVDTTEITEEVASVETAKEVDPEETPYTTSRTCFTTWFDLKDLSKDSVVAEDDINASVDFVAGLLAEEKPNIKLVVGGFGMGAATALHFAICAALGKLNDNVKPSGVVALSGWLPKTNSTYSEVSVMLPDITSAMSIYFLCDAEGDVIVSPHLSEDARKFFSSTLGFKNVDDKVKTFKGGKWQHKPNVNAMKTILDWLEKLGKPADSEKTNTQPGVLAVLPSGFFRPMVISPNVLRPLAPLPSFKCPVDGIVFLSPGADESPYVKVGDKVQKDQVLCEVALVQALLARSNLTADKAGTIKSIVAEDGRVYQTGARLFTYEPDEA